MRIPSPYLGSLGSMQSHGAGALSSGFLLDVIAAQGLAVPDVAIDCSLATSGNLINVGTDAGHMAPEGSVGYQQSFPATVSGTGVNLPTTTTDRFVGSSSGVGDVGGTFTIFLVFTLPTLINPSNLLAKRQAATANGWEINNDSAATGRLRFVTDDGTNTEIVSLSGAHDDGNDHYCTFGVDQSGTPTQFGSSDLVAEVTETATVGTNFASTANMVIGYDDNRANGFSGVMRYVVVWNGVAYRTAAMASLWTALGGS